ncbi:hypothetical protein H072_9289 [Dactylellina haptotyla CBS 200.50]|uniref:F-box domain-containing protein n=1 Tax=Dactylellina haptotyla (strain CBS 200.50) TaxID=1284197 RepID=S8A259_DACHA|nr:hypothetical protein H072_9289 [Dactylellina haptotyla CBS 200.50]
MGGRTTLDYDPTGKGPAVHLPFEIYIEIFSYLSFPEQLCASIACKHWQSVILASPLLKRRRYHPRPEATGISNFHRLLDSFSNFAIVLQNGRITKYNYEWIENGGDTKEFPGRGWQPVIGSNGNVVGYRERGHWWRNVDVPADCPLLDEMVFSPYIDYQCLTGKNQTYEAPMEAPTLQSLRMNAMTRFSVELTMATQNEKMPVVYVTGGWPGSTFAWTVEENRSIRAVGEIFAATALASLVKRGGFKRNQEYEIRFVHFRELRTSVTGGVGLVGTPSSYMYRTAIGTLRGHFKDYELMENT